MKPVRVNHPIHATKLGFPYLTIGYDHVHRMKRFGPALLTGYLLVAAAGFIWLAFAADHREQFVVSEGPVVVYKRPVPAGLAGLDESVVIGHLDNGDVVEGKRTYAKDFTAIVTEFDGEDGFVAYSGRLKTTP